MTYRTFVTCALLAAPLGARADCGYVRTSYQEVSCKPIAPEKEPPSEAASSTTTLPGLEDAAVGPLDELTCDCTYVLEGSNPLCDSDREENFSQTYPQDPSVPVCRRGKSLCATVCPRQLR